MYLFIGPVCFQKKTITGNIYFDMTENYAYLMLGGFKPNVILQQDGALPHWNLLVRESLNEMSMGWAAFKISRPYTPRDFYVRGYVKGQLLKSKVTNFHDLKKMIAEAFENIEDEIRHKV